MSARGGDKAVAAESPCDKQGQTRFAHGTASELERLCDVEGGLRPPSTTYRLRAACGGRAQAVTTGVSDVGSWRKNSIP